MKNLLILLFLLINSPAFSQVAFKTIKGKKASYSLKIPKTYYKKQAIGKNIDLKYTNADGASIIVIVNTVPGNSSKNSIYQMRNISNEALINQLSFGGTERVKLLKRKFEVINGRNSFVLDYKDSELYTHSIMQYRNGKIIHLQYTCPLEKKSSYLPYIFRVSNSLK